ncbi:MAG: hypothetical protein LBI30_01515 [Holosporales bacterium]|jgi:hypothetical protein|nr:hypothetical protein [Holosporales bacterium]
MTRKTFAPKMAMKPNDLGQTLNDLQQIYKLAFDSNDLNAAIKAKELISKICGFLDHKKTNKPFDINKISEQELEEIIAQLRSELGG